MVPGLWFLVSEFWLNTYGNENMATIKRFEDIEAWQKARELTREIYARTNIGRFARDFGLQNQIRKAAISIMSNIAEGFERGGTAELLHFLSIAKGPAGEVEAQLYIALDQNYLKPNQFDTLMTLTTSIKKLIAGFMEYLKKCGYKGQKFKK